MIGTELALRDINRDRSAFVCFVIGLAAVLAPLLVLFAMKTGIVASLLDELRRDPATLEIRLRGNHDIDPQAYAEIAALSGIGFIVPAPRTIAARLTFEAPDGRIAVADILPSAAGDPLLRGAPAPSEDEVVLSEALVAELGVGAGAALTAIVDRGGAGGIEEAALPVEAIGIARRGDLPGNRALVAVALAEDVEAYRDGYAVPRFGGAGRPMELRTQSYESLRLFAAGIEDVLELDAALRARGLAVVSQAGAVRNVLDLQRNLDFIFAVIAAIGTLGFSVSLAVSLWANVERKRTSLATLRLMGMTARELLLFPLTQAVAVAVAGSLLAGGTYVLVAASLNQSFVESLPSGGAVASLPAVGFVAAFLCTLAVSLLAAVAGGIRLTRLQPKEAMRDD